MLSRWGQWFDNNNNNINFFHFKSIWKAQSIHHSRRHATHNGEDRHGRVWMSMARPKGSLALITFFYCSFVGGFAASQLNRSAMTKTPCQVDVACNSIQDQLGAEEMKWTTNQSDPSHPMLIPVQTVLWSLLSDSECSSQKDTDR